MTDERPSSPYDEFNARANRWVTRIRVWLLEHPTGSWIQMGLFIVTALYATFTYQLLKSAIRTQEVASQQLEAMDRPWVKIELSLAGPTRVENGSAAFFPLWSLQNVGRSVAVEVYNEWAVYIQPFSQKAFTEPVEHQKGTCARADQPDRIRLGRVVFPNEIKRDVASFTVDPGQLRDAQARSPDGLVSSIVLTGCIGYRWDTATRRHHTGFIYEITSADGRTLVADRLFAAPQPPSEFKIEPFFFASAVVD